MSLIQTNVHLPDICSLITDGTHDSPKLQTTGVPFVKGKHINTGRIDFDNCDYITREDHEKCIKRVKPETNDILLANIGASIGDCARVTGGSEFSIKNLALLRPDPDKVDPSYFYHFVKSAHFQGKLLNQRLGAAQPYVSLQSFRSLKVDIIGSKASQAKIGEIANSYDDLIENNRRRIQLLEQAARLLYKEWFVHLRFPGHEHVKIKGGVPDGWEDMFLPDVIAVNPNTPIEKGKEVRYVPMSALSESGMTADISNFELRTKHTNVKFRKNDVLLARITPCLENGKTGLAYFLRDNEVACGSTEFIVLRGKRVSYAYTYCLARSYPFRENAIKSMIGSSGRQRVQVSCFDEYKVPMPPKHLLEMFDEITNESFEQIRVLMAQNDRLAKARELLLPRLMNGEIIT